MRTQNETPSDLKLLPVSLQFVSFRKLSEVNMLIKEKALDAGSRKTQSKQYLKQLQEWKSWSNLKEQLPQSGTEAETERELAFPLEEIIRKKQVLLCPQTSMVSMVCLCIPSSLQPLVIKGLYCALQ